jgi:hypothetical protein
MDRPEELAKYAGICRANGFQAPEDGARQLCRQMAGDDEDVFNAIWLTWNFENAFDDLIDQDGIEDEIKLCAMAALHDALVETLDHGHGAAHLRFLQACAHLERRTHWSTARKNLAAAAIQRFFVMLESNPFIRTNAAQIKAMMVQTMLRCLTGDLMARSEDPRKRALAPAVRCGDVDLFMHMIYLARGFAAASVWCGKLGYDTADGPAGHQEGKN